MTLKDKLQKEKLYINPHSFKLTKEGAESFEKIANDFAIGFAEWMLGDDAWRVTKETLENYKQTL